MAFSAHNSYPVAIIHHSSPIFFVFSGADIDFGLSFAILLPALGEAHLIEPEKSQS
jgi:hypothetical protein